MSLVQSRCRLDLVQHHLPIRFGRETSNKFNVIKLQKNVFLHLCQQQSFQVAVNPHWSAASTSQIEGWSQLWHTTRTRFVASAWRRNEFESGGGGHPSGAKRRDFFVVPLHFFGLKVQLVVLVSAFVMVSTVWPVSRFPCPVESAPLFVAMLCVAVMSLTLTALTRLFRYMMGSHTHQSFASTPIPLIFLKTHRICINLKTGPGAGGGGGFGPICPPPPVTTLMNIA